MAPAILIAAGVMVVAGDDPPAAKPAKPAKPPLPTSQLYGATGGEKTQPADSSLPSIPLRARKIDTFYKLISVKKDNIKTPARIGKAAMDAPALTITYQVTSAKALTGNVSVNIRTADGADYQSELANDLKDRGSISLYLSGGIRIIGGIPQRVANKDESALPANFEVFFVRNEPRYGKDLKRSFKVSNSIYLGKSDFDSTLARDWTEEEIAAFSHPPVEGPKPGLYKNVGVDTERAGGTGLGTRRYVDPKRPLLGLDITDSAWAGEKCLGQAMPIYDREYPDFGGTRILADPGYAVGAVTVKSKTYVNAVKITFMKLKANNTLDPTDSYESDWQGAKQVVGKETKLGGDGRKVIGVVEFRGSILDGLALVMEPAKK
ncbi:hypothetical protein [Fimbriiglobus ruber]|uniref:Uncharacterized protein n=1 Tax=Fimbriiglobus ruber TaxID=1908690 RepID=A0A225E0P3_9BACT|nr:hypothetical protein [Fimbriiglobus ruber]OWK45374.1 hypothetical protein FRUB_01705 [Fimbriiglobus ruber]